MMISCTWFNTNAAQPHKKRASDEALFREVRFARYSFTTYVV